jgi:geranylgeranylglycerol-phosphate geranylgeranyltransferase
MKIASVSLNRKEWFSMTLETTEPTVPRHHIVTDILALSHIFNGISSACGAGIGFLITAWYHQEPISLSAFLPAVLAVLLISNGGFIINDIIDLNIDRINRPDRPLAAGRISVWLAWTLYLLYTLIGIGLGVLVNAQTGLLAGITALGLFLYSAVLKKRFIVGHLTIAAMGAMLLPFGGAAAGHLIPTLYTIPVTGLAFFAREVLKTIPDVEGDRAHGVVNISTRFGTKTAMDLSRGMLVVAAVILPVLQAWWPLNPWFMLMVMVIVWPATFISLFGRGIEIIKILRFSKLLFLLVAVALLIGSVPF